MRVLVVDDEPMVRDALSLALRIEGYTVSVAADGLDALRVVGAERPDAVLLDVMMPRMDGFEMCRRLRADGLRLPVLLITAVDTADDRDRARTVGADEYVVKPFECADGLARLRRLLERPAVPAQRTALGYADITLDTVAHRLRRGGRSVQLSRTECQLLEALLREPDRAVSRQALLEEVWGYDFGGGSKILDAYLAALRGKLVRLAAGCELRDTAAGFALHVPA